ncbi:ABC transporter ATP-binding protein [Microbacterium terrisoli]|jgi:NitT/TauT family transport system ATP-binding protein|uniref:ABC transporter ATP-binding protein n=1 Tax=Microbacterium terrisoli TaxID=3242192 RepID=UPI002804FCCE|nr:ABC transporter ATP-binding protein [Microbacterium protaetiae]
MNQIKGDIMDASSSVAIPDRPIRVKTDSLSKEFRTAKGVTTAVHSVDLEILRGEFITVVGRSGCGKTTLLRMIGGLLAPTSGSVQVDDKELWNGGRVDSAAIARLGFVFQESNLLPWFNVVDNIALPLKLHGVSKSARRARAAELADLVGLAGFESAYPRQLSGGMRQRVAIARALSTEPDLLLMDEPFGALDALTRERMNLELQRIVGETESTVVFVTHDIPEAVFLGDRIVHMTPRPGRVSQVLSIEIPKPREIVVQTEPEFNEIVRDLRTKLDQDD